MKQLPALLCLPPDHFSSHLFTLVSLSLASGCAGRWASSGCGSAAGSRGDVGSRARTRCVASSLEMCSPARRPSVRAAQHACARSARLLTRCSCCPSRTHTHTHVCVCLRAVRKSQRIISIGAYAFAARAAPAARATRTNTRQSINLSQTSSLSLIGLSSGAPHIDHQAGLAAAHCCSRSLLPLPGAETRALLAAKIFKFSPQTGGEISPSPR